MEKREQARKGDVYRGVKVGAVFQAERGRERSELAPEVFIDAPKEGSMRYPAFRAQGMHVGSGIAEAACKTVVAARLKRYFHAFYSPRLGCSLALALFQASWRL